MIPGSMQPYALTLDKFLDHAAKWHPRSEVVTAGEDRKSVRVDYAGLKVRAKRVSAALTCTGMIAPQETGLDSLTEISEGWHPRKAKAMATATAFEVC